MFIGVGEFEILRIVAFFFLWFFFGGWGAGIAIPVKVSKQNETGSSWLLHIAADY